jgi:hypothetical protein
MPIALLERIVILLRDQQLTPPQLLALAERFGGIGEYPLGNAPARVPAGAADPLRAHDRVNFGDIWPPDGACLERAALAPGMATRAAVVKPGRLAGAEVPHLE